MDILYFDDFLSDEVLKTCQDYIESFSGQDIEVDEEFVSYFWEKNSKKIQDINPEWVGLYNKITKTNNSKPLNKHKDKKLFDEKYKMFIYLNDVENGGTIFFVDDKEILIENKINRLVIFNIDILHASQYFIEKKVIKKKNVIKKKKVIGFRLRGK
jgi:hypothetical protein